MKLPDVPILFLKATTTKTITIPGYTRSDGTYVPPHQKIVHYDPDKSAHDVLGGAGSHSQKKALAKLSKLLHWGSLSPDEQHAHVLSSATNIQKKASASAAVSGWKDAMKAGKKPTASQQAAFDELSPAKKDALLAEVGAKPALTSAPAAEPVPASPAAAPAAVGDVFKLDSQYAKMNAGQWKVYNVSPDGELVFMHKVGATKPNEKNSATIPVATLQAAIDAGTATKQGEPADDGAVTVTSVKLLKDPIEGPMHVISFSNGNTASIVKLNSSESMGLPGWHDADAVGEGGSYLSDFKDEAIAAMLAKQQAAQPAHPAALHTFSNPDDGLQATVHVAAGGGFNVVLQDTDSGEFVSTVTTYPTEAAAIASAKKAAGVKDGPKEGDTKQGADGVLVLKDGHWVKQGDPLDGVGEGWEAASDGSNVYADHPTEPALHGVSSWSVMSKQKATDPGKVFPTAEAWLAANPGGEADLSSTLVDLGYLHVAKVMGIYHPPGTPAPAPAHSDDEHNEAALKVAELVAGTGGLYPVKAAKKLHKDGAFDGLKGVDALAKVVALAKDMQAVATASAAVSGWNKAALAGKNPTNSQWKAFYALPSEKKSTLLAAVEKVVGNTDHLEGPSVQATEPAAADPDVAPSAPKPGDYYQSKGEVGGLGYEGPVHSPKVDFSAVEKLLGMPASSLADPDSTTYTVAGPGGLTFSIYKHAGSLSVRTSGKNKDDATAAAFAAFLEQHAPAKSAAPASTAMPKVTKVTSVNPEKVPAAVKKLQAIEPSAIAAWLTEPSGKKSDHAMSFFEHITKPAQTKFIKWMTAAGKFGYSEKAKASFKSAAIASLYGMYDLALLSDGSWAQTTKVPDGVEVITDPAKIQAAAIAEKVGVSDATMAAIAQSSPAAAPDAPAPDAAPSAPKVKALTQSQINSVGKFATNIYSSKAKAAAKSGDGVKLAEAYWGAVAAGFSKTANKIMFLSTLMGASLSPPAANAAPSAEAKSVQFDGYELKQNSVGAWYEVGGNPNDTYSTDGYQHQAINLLAGLPPDPAFVADAVDFYKDKAVEKAVYVGVRPEVALNAIWPADGNGGPKEGDTKTVDGVTYVLKNGRWHKQGEPEPAAAPAAAAISDLDWSTFHNTTAGHNKFWSVAVSGSKVITHYGKIGTNGQTNEKVMPSPAMAHDHAAKLAQQKKAKGYVAHWQASGPAATPSVPDATAASFAGKKIVGAHIPADSVTPMVADGWEQTGGQGGYNEGGVFKDPDGQEWYLKFPAGGEDVVKNELLAGRLYALAGLPFPETRLVTKDGKIGHASKMIGGLKKDKAALLAGTAPGLLSGFAVDAWLANWDTVGNNPAAGKGFDNIQIGPDGTAYRIDAGGSMLYGGAGGKKTAFGDEVIELATMLDPGKNAHTAAVFGKMSKADIAASVAKVAALTDDQIKAAVDKYGPGGPSAKAKLAATLIARKGDMLAKFPQAAKGATKKPKKAPVFDPSKLGTPPDFLNWSGPGKHGPATAEYKNVANQQGVNKLLDVAKATGSIDAVKAVTFPFYGPDGAVTHEVTALDHPSQYVKGFAQQLINEIDFQLNPPEVFRFTGDSPIKDLHDKFPVHGDVSGAAKKLGYYVILGKSDALPAAELAKMPKHTFANGKLTTHTYVAKSNAALAKIPMLQKDALKSYTGGGYSAQNKSLWKGNPTGNAKSAAEALATHGYEITPGTILSRKISLSGSDLTQMVGKDLVNASPGKVGVGGATGMILQEPAISSTSIRPSCWGGNVHLKMTVGPGVKGIYVGSGTHNEHGHGSSGFSNHPGEHEVILPPNARMLVQKVSRSPAGGDPDGFGNGPDYVVEVLILPNDQ